MADIRPIDANALKERAKEMEIFMPYGGDGTTMAVEVYSIDNMPTLDYAPVRHGEWKFDAFTAKHGNPYRCSICEEEFDDTHNFCPSCGAKMDGGKKDG